MLKGRLAVLDIRCLKLPVTVLGSYSLAGVELRQYRRRLSHSTRVLRPMTTRSSARLANCTRGCLSQT